MVSFSIFSGVTLTRAGQFSTVEQGLDFIKRLLIAFLLGFAVATGVSLLIVPFTSRQNVFKDIMAYAKAIHRVFETQTAYVQVAQHPPWLSIAATSDEDIDGPSDERHCQQPPVRTSARGDLKSAMAALIGIHDKMAADLALAKSEMAWGKLDATELHSMFILLRSVMLPLAGISMLPEIFESMPGDWIQTDETPHMRDQWGSFLQYFTQELMSSSELVMLGIEHAIIVLGVASTKATQQLRVTTSLQQKRDIEKSAQRLVPGDQSFATRFETDILEFHSGRRNEVAKALRAQPNANRQARSGTLLLFGARDSEEVFICLFLEHLMDALLQRSLNIVKFADSEIGGKKLEHGRLIFPQARSMGLEFLTNSDGNPDCQERDDKAWREGHRDPEHMPATNSWEKFGEGLASIPRFLPPDKALLGSAPLPLHLRWRFLHIFAKHRPSSLSKDLHWCSSSSSSA